MGDVTKILHLRSNLDWEGKYTPKRAGVDGLSVTTCWLLGENWCRRYKRNVPLNKNFPFSLQHSQYFPLHLPSEIQKEHG